jgi:hypothetical protein
METNPSACANSVATKNRGDSEHHFRWRESLRRVRIYASRKLLGPVGRPALPALYSATQQVLYRQPMENEYRFSHQYSLVYRQRSDLVSGYLFIRFLLKSAAWSDSVEPIRGWLGAR